jgi:uncharacterized protein
MPIPATVQADRAIARGEQFEEVLPLERLERLAEFAPGTVRGTLQAGRDRAGQAWLKGGLSGTLRLVCQVCQSPFDWAFEAPVSLALVKSEEEEERLLASAEPCLVSNDRLELHEIVSDEVLLGLPMMPRCGACENVRPADSGSGAGEGSTRPFAVLKQTGLSGDSKARRK